jgi:myosin heavy subunit
LSTLTKVLIVLLTVFSIFLCGIVVTYVANAENQRDRADGLQRSIQAAKSSEADAQQQLDEEKKRAQAEKAQLDEQIAAKSMEINDLKGKLDDAERMRDQWAQKAAGMAAAVETANAASKQQTTLFQTTQQEVQQLRAEQTNRRKELDETNQMLLERMAVVSQLEEKVRRLTEENQDVETRLNQYLQQYGRITAKPQTTVAPRATSVLPMQSMAGAPAQTRTINLNGQVTAVDMKSKLAELSIGTAAGVRQEMKFHVTRGDRWVADLLILEVWPDKAVGIVDRVQQGMEPRVGDKAATNL